MTDMKIDLDEVRKQVDLIDFRILKLLSERMEYVMRIRRLKDVVTDPKREQMVIGNIQKHSQGLVRPDFSEKLFNEIINESKRIQEQNLKSVGFQGEHGAYGEVAAITFDKSMIPLPCREFSDVFEVVSDGQIDFGIVPVENSLEGAVTEVNDLLVETNLKIAGEVKLPIHHSLMTLPDTDYREIKVVYSHPQALAQCRGFLSRNNLEPVPFYDTAGAAKMLSDTRAKATAVIASKSCAELYNLEIIKEEIEDDKSNSTRFLILAKEPNEAPCAKSAGYLERNSSEANHPSPFGLRNGSPRLHPCGKTAGYSAKENKKPGDKCSIIFSTRHEAGTLFAVLKIFSDAGINLTRIESRPIRNDPGKYAFFLDFQGSDRDTEVKKALELANQKSVMFKFLGCYKEAVL